MPASPWEIGLAETQQTLVLNGLRGRVARAGRRRLRTGRDVAIAALLGADEFGFATAPLIAAGCIMMRKCHLNTCPVGIATQDPVLRARFTGAARARDQLFLLRRRGTARDHGRSSASARVDEMIGRTDLLDTRPVVEHWKARGIDLTPLLLRAAGGARVARFNSRAAGPRPRDVARPRADRSRAAGARTAASRCASSCDVRNVNRSVGAMLSGEVARRFGHDGLPQDSIIVRLNGTAGQSFGAFLAHGVTLELTGDANDYVGKGLRAGA